MLSDTREPSQGIMLGDVVSPGESSAAKVPRGCAGTSQCQDCHLPPPASNCSLPPSHSLSLPAFMFDSPASPWSSQRPIIQGWAVCECTKTLVSHRRQLRRCRNCGFVILSSLHGSLQPGRSVRSSDSCERCLNLSPATFLLSLLAGDWSLSSVY